MAQQDKNTYEGTFNSPTTGVFKDNATGDIGADDARTLVTNTKDSVPFTVDDSYTWAFPKANTSGTNTYAVTLSPAITAYTNGMKIHVKVKDASTGASTLNANTVGAKKIFTNPTTQAGNGDLVDEQEYIMSYDSALDGGSGGWLIIGGGSASVPSASESTPGIAEIATQAETNAGTDDERIVTPLKLKTFVNDNAPKVLVIACSDEVTPITAATNKVKFRMPYAMTVSAVRASLSTAQTSGSIFTVDINDSGTTILSTKLTIDNGETTSTTAATPPVISDTALADNAEISIDVDQIGDNTAKGLKVTLIGS